MDPNHWNTYNLQYGHTAPGLNLSNIQGAPGSLSGRPVSTIPGISYPGLDMPSIIGSMPTLPVQSPHKAMTLQQGQIIFDPQVRVSEQQTSPRYEAPKAAFTGNQQLLEAASRMQGLWNNTNLYSQFGSLLSHMTPAVSSVPASPPAGSSSKMTSQGQLHEPPPAHSSNPSRLSAIQRHNAAASEIFYPRTETINPADSIFNSLYSTGALPKQVQPAPSPSPLRQAHHVPGFSQHSDIEDLSANSQAQLYQSYTGMQSSDPQTYSPGQIQQDMTYDAVSPAPTQQTLQQEAPPSSQANPGFSIVQFPDLANLTSEHAHTLANNYVENDFRLKMDPSHLHPSAQRISQDLPQQHHQKAQRPNLWNQIGSPGLPVTSAFSSSSLQQPPPANTITAMADSTTKPKRIRNRKKKPDIPASPHQQLQQQQQQQQHHHQEIKKETIPLQHGQARQPGMSQQSSHILNMPISSPVPTLNPAHTAGLTAAQLTQINQQTFRTVSGTSHYTPQDIKVFNQDIKPPRPPSTPQRISQPEVDAGMYRNIPERQQQHMQAFRGSPMPQQEPSPRQGVPLSQPHGFQALGPRVEGQPYDALDVQEGAQFTMANMDFGGQPFMQELVTPVYPGEGEVVYATLVSAAERQQQQEDFRPTYHGEAVHEIRAVGPLQGQDPTQQFGSFFTHQQQQMEQPQIEEQDDSLTFVPAVGEDEELCDFTVNTEVIPKVTEPTEKTKELRDSFQKSFLSYLQGAKQETLSSVSTSAVTKKPMLPKYIPEPRRPRPPPPTPKESFSTLGRLEEGQSKVRSKVNDLISGLTAGPSSPQTQGHPRPQMDKGGGYSVQKTSDLAIKIKLPKSAVKNKFGIISDNSLLTQNMKGRSKEAIAWNVKGKKKKGQPQEFDLDEDEDLQPRQTIKRKAKASDPKKKKYTEIDDFDVAPPAKKGIKGDEGSDYDSDKDPVWMPFEVDLKQQGFELEGEKRRKSKKPRHRLPAPKSVSVRPPQPTHYGLPSETTGSTGYIIQGYMIGSYILEKKDQHNYEAFPVWRIEKDAMMRKFELKIVDGAIRHYPGGTFSTWTSSMESQFILLKVHEVPGKSKSEPLWVEVAEESRPKPPSDGRLESKYEDDPLVETFNVYLQVFLSQALEPSFLKAIIETDEKFYVNALNMLDKIILEKCQKIGKITQWKKNFEDCLHKCPLMKEIDRPNLKQPCQACENSSPPTIKSVLFSGHAYDRFLLTHLGPDPDPSQEFMVGKTAAHYVRPYHTLYHFKYWLKQRCDSKVKMMRESDKSEDTSSETILDKCLENRNWVLQLFDNLTKLLRFEEGHR